MRASHFNLARVALVKKNVADAKMHADEFRKSAETSNNPNQVKLSHELAGLIAMAINAVTVVCVSLVTRKPNAAGVALGVRLHAHQLVRS